MGDGVEQVKEEHHACGVIAGLSIGCHARMPFGMKSRGGLAGRNWDYTHDAYLYGTKRADRTNNCMEAAPGARTEHMVADVCLTSPTRWGPRQIRYQEPHIL